MLPSLLSSLHEEAQRPGRKELAGQQDWMREKCNIFMHLYLPGIGYS
jgi:hypothetical protein